MKRLRNVQLACVVACLIGCQSKAAVALEPEIDPPEVASDVAGIRENENRPEKNGTAVDRNLPQILQGPHLLTDSCMSHKYCIGRRAERAMVFDGNKSTQDPNGHVHLDLL